MDNGCDNCKEAGEGMMCVEHEIEFLKWCITANRARIKELEQEQERNKSCEVMTSTGTVATSKNLM